MKNKVEFEIGQIVLFSCLWTGKDKLFNINSITKYHLKDNDGNYYNKKYCYQLKK